MFKDLKLAPSERRLFWLALAIVLVAKGPALFYLIYGADAWGITLDGLSLRQQVHMGRPALAFVIWLFEKFGLEPVRAPVLSALASSAIWTYVATLVLRIWGLRLPLVAAVPLVAMIAAHPYTAEPFTHREITLFQSISLLLGAAGYVVVRKEFKHFMAALALFVFSLAMFQATISFFSIVWLITLAIQVANRFRESNLPDQPAIFRKADLIKIVLLVVSAAIYFVLIKITYLITGVAADPRTRLIAFGEIPDRFRLLLRTLEEHLFFGSPLLPVGVSAVLLTCLALIPVVMLVATFRQNADGGRFKNILGIAYLISLLILAAFAIVGVAIPSSELFVSPRIIAQIGVFWAGMFSIGLSLAIGRWRKLYVGSAWIVAISYVSLTNGVLMDQYRVNVRDAAMANRIISRLEESEGFGEVERVAIVGYRWGFKAPIPSSTGSMNVSAFTFPFSNIALLNEIAGLRWEPALPEEQAKAECYCDQPDREWPSSEAIHVDGPVAIICIKRPK